MRILLTVIFLLLIRTCYSQHMSLYKKEQIIQGKDTLHYRILLPENYKASERYPLIVFLHGSGERGNDNQAQLKWGGSLFLQDSIRKKYPAIVVFPQCPAGQQWTTIQGNSDSTAGRRVRAFLSGISNAPGKLTIALIEKLIAQKRVDTQRIYLGGLSLGGFGTFVLAAERPDRFAAAFPICGGGGVKLAQKYNPKTAWWIFHGAKDEVVDPDYSRRFFQELKQKNFDVQYTEYPEARHDSWTNAFREPKLLAWLFSHKL